MIFNSEQEKAEYITEVIDKLLYCDGFKEELTQLMSKHKIPEKIKVNHKASDFNIKTKI